MRGDIDGLPDLQAKVISDICTWSNAERFIVCPTYYSYDSRLTREFGSPPKTYLRDFGRIVDRSIDVFWTGEKIIADGYSATHLTDVAAELDRKPFIWDNHISNDSKIRTNHLFLDPLGEAWELPADLVAGIAINPVNQPYLSRIALSNIAIDCSRCRLGGKSHLTFAGIFSNRRSRNAWSQMASCCRRLDSINSTPVRVLRLLDSYEAEKFNPYAQKIAAWLRGEYIFGPECLTT
jgi:hyaluronoglucosaminidase